MKSKIVLIIGIILFLILIAKCGNSETDEDNTNTIPNTEFEDIDSITANISKEVKKTWKETISEDEMTDSKNIWKEVVSDNEIEFDFPYNGGSNLTITVRYMKKYGTNVLISLSKGQLLCNDYNGTNYINVRFDSNPPIKFTTSEPSDLDSNTLFISNPKRFIREAKKAKTIKIEVPVYEEGLPLFTFTLDEPLTWKY